MLRVEAGYRSVENKKVNFGFIDRVALFGGSQLVGALCLSLARRGLSIILFSSMRHLDDAVEMDGSTLRQVVERLNIPYCSTDDINVEPALSGFVTLSTLGLAGGAAWVFEEQTAALFSGRLLDFMGIALPQYRGGAHHTWRILRKSRQGCCSLQVIHGGRETFHKGEIIKRREYTYPTSARIPQDYSDAATPQELAFLEEFLEQVAQGDDFELQPLQESFSTYFPFLYTLKHGFIDWSWGTEEIERFICAFDSPYVGASTFVEGQRVFLKNCYAEYSDGGFHPFLVGLVYRRTDGALYVATHDGTIVVRSVGGESGQNPLESIQLGQRFYTPRSVLEEALQFDAVYGTRGIQKAD